MEKHTETKQKERIRRLMELLKKTDQIHLKKAARMLEIPVVTIRRDLSQDDEPLPLTLLGGYIVMVNKPTAIVNAPFPAQKQYYRDDLPVAILAAGLVSENDLVLFDNGAEMPLVVSMILDDISFTGTCHSHRVFITPNEKPSTTVILCGGIYRTKSDAFCDTSNPSPLDALNPRKVFISTSGVHEHFDVNWFNPDGLATKHKAMERGSRKILLTRHALFDEVAPASTSPLSTFDVLISDRPLLADYAIHCRDGSVKVITPDSDGD